MCFKVSCVVLKFPVPGVFSLRFHRGFSCCIVSKWVKWWLTQSLHVRHVEIPLRHCAREQWLVVERHHELHSQLHIFCVSGVMDGGFSAFPLQRSSLHVFRYRKTASPDQAKMSESFPQLRLTFLERRRSCRSSKTARIRRTCGTNELAETPWNIISTSALCQLMCRSTSLHHVHEDGPV